MAVRAAKDEQHQDTVLLLADVMSGEALYGIPLSAIRIDSIEAIPPANGSLRATPARTSEVGAWAALGHKVETTGRANIEGNVKGTNFLKMYRETLLRLEKAWDELG